MVTGNHGKTMITQTDHLFCLPTDSQLPPNPVGCLIPTEFHGDWYSREGDAGENIFTLVNADKWETGPDGYLTCHQIHNHSNPGIQQEGNNFTMLMREV